MEAKYLAFVKWSQRNMSTTAFSSNNDLVCGEVLQKNDRIAGRHFASGVTKLLSIPLRVSSF